MTNPVTVVTVITVMTAPKRRHHCMRCDRRHKGSDTSGADRNSEDGFPADVQRIRTRAAWHVPLYQESSRDAVKPHSCLRQRGFDETFISRFALKFFGRQSVEDTLRIRNTFLPNLLAVGFGLPSRRIGKHVVEFTFDFDHERVAVNHKRLSKSRSSF